MSKAFKSKQRQFSYKFPFKSYVSHRFSIAFDFMTNSVWNASFMLAGEYFRLERHGKRFLRLWIKLVSAQRETLRIFLFHFGFLERWKSNRKREKQSSLKPKRMLFLYHLTDLNSPGGSNKRLAEWNRIEKTFNEISFIWGRIQAFVLHFKLCGGKFIKFNWMARKKWLELMKLLRNCAMLLWGIALLLPLSESLAASHDESLRTLICLDADDDDALGHSENGKALYHSNH